MSSIIETLVKSKRSITPSSKNAVIIAFLDSLESSSFGLKGSVSDEHNDLIHRRVSRHCARADPRPPMASIELPWPLKPELKHYTPWIWPAKKSILIFDQNFDFWPKFRFLIKISIFDRNFDFWPKFRFLTEFSISGTNLEFRPKGFDFYQIFIFGTNFDFSPIFHRFLNKIMIFNSA